LERPHDPLRRIVVPVLDESDTDGELDISGEEKNTRTNGI